MRFIIDEFIGRNRLNHPVTFQLIKQANGDSRIKRSGKTILMMSSKQTAIETFEKIRKEVST